MNRTPLLGLLALLTLPVVVTACSSYQGGAELDADLLLLDGEGLDGRLYMLAPRAESVIAIDPTTLDFEAIPVGREPTVLSRPPGSDTLYTLERRDATLSRLSTAGAVVTEDLGAPFTTLTWSPDGTRAIAWFDPAEVGDLEVEGSLNLNAYAAIAAGDGALTISDGSLTFEPRSVSFSADSSKALIATSDRLHVVDLLTDPISELAVPFDLDDATRATPLLVVPGPLGERALVTVTGVPDLFVLSLDPVQIENVAPLVRSAHSVAWSADGTRAIIADGTRTVTFLELQTNDVEQLVLSHDVNKIQMSQLPDNSFALLYDDGDSTPFLTRVELADDGAAPEDSETYPLEGPVGRVDLSPGETAAVIFHDDSNTDEWVPVQSLSLFHFEERAPSRILLDAPAWDMIFLGEGVIGGSEDEHVIVVLKNSGRLVRYNLRTYGQVVLDTYPLPHAIGRVPPADGGAELLYVIHDQDLGLVSFLPPDTSQVPSGGFPAVAGVAVTGLLDGR